MVNSVLFRFRTLHCLDSAPSFNSPQSGYRWIPNWFAYILRASLFYGCEWAKLVDLQNYAHRRFGYDHRLAFPYLCMIYDIAFKYIFV